MKFQPIEKKNYRLPRPESRPRGSSIRRPRGDSFVTRSVELVGGIGAKVGSRKNRGGGRRTAVRRETIRGKEGRTETTNGERRKVLEPSRVSLFVVPFKFSSGEAEAESFTAFKPVLVGRQRSFSRRHVPGQFRFALARVARVAGCGHGIGERRKDRGRTSWKPERSGGRMEEGGRGIMELARRKHSGREA